MKVHVAVPAYDGKVCVETARALLNEQTAALVAGIELEVSFAPGCSLITAARNQIVAGFLNTDADRLVFIDSDVSWEPGELLKLASHPVDFVGGAYRYKQEPEAYPVGWITERAELIADPETGLLEVDTLPAGFLALNRAVFERLHEAFPGRDYEHFGQTFTAYFHAPYRDGRLYGEDAAFCADWRAIGGEVWLDPELSLTHVGGVNRYAGHIGDWLRNRTPHG